VDEIKELGLHLGWIYEVVISTLVDGRPHSAPVGVWTDDYATFHMHMFNESRTLGGILATGFLVANFPSDAGTFATVLLNPGSAAYEPAQIVAVPRLRDCPTAVELTLKEATVGGDGTHIVATALLVHRQGAPRLFNRAEHLLLESLILATRFAHLDRPRTIAALVENYRVVQKVAPGSTYERAMTTLLHSLNLST